MIVSPLQRKPSTLTKLLSWTRPFKVRSAEQQVYTEDAFRFELQKERSRVDRRSVESRFSVVLVNGIGFKQLGAQPEIILALRERLRITDTIGWFENRLTILLPETDREGAEFVIDEFDSIAEFYELDIRIEVCVYPDDDQVATNSREFRGLDEFEQSSEEDFGASGALASFHADKELLDNNFPCVTEATPVWKRGIDILGASAGLFMLSPVLAAAAIAVKCSGKGPVLFRQKREGKNGQPFEIFKFRTMCSNAEDLKSRLLEFSEQDGPAFKLENDPRITNVGKYLRKSCIDELPQLLNVLRGEMSLVGPRPLPVNESVECQIWQRKRLEVAPGLTCIWQVRGDRNTKFSDWMRMDMEYIRRRSLVFDLKLIFETIFVAVLHRGSV